MMKKFFKHERAGVVAFYKYYDTFRKFELAFFQHITGLNEQYMWDNHRCFMEECRAEILRDYGILTDKTKLSTRYLIPKDNLELIGWVKTNCTLELTELKRILIVFEFHKVSTYWRSLSEEHNLRFGPAPKIQL